MIDQFIAWFTAISFWVITFLAGFVVVWLLMPRFPKEEATDPSEDINVKAVWHLDENDLKKIITDWLANDKEKQVVKMTFRASPVFDAKDQPTGGSSVTCEVEVDES